MCHSDENPLVLKQWKSKVWLFSYLARWNRCKIFWFIYI